MNLREYYRWQIMLIDGSGIDQSNDGDNEPFKFDSRNKDFDKIKSIKLIPKEVNSHELSEVTVVIPDGAKLIYFRRTITNTGNAFPKFQLTLIGWQLNTSANGKSKNIKYILYIYPDGKILATDKNDIPTEEYIATLPLKNAADIEDCIGCQPELVKTETDDSK